VKRAGRARREADSSHGDQSRRSLERERLGLE
jgi:hypothetical protein